MPTLAGSATRITDSYGQEDQYLRRRLGSLYNDDQDAISIKSPLLLSTPILNKPHVGGIRPTNTLNRGANEAVRERTRGASHATTQSTGLRLRAVQGQNIKRNRHLVPGIRARDVPTSNKRRKIDLDPAVSSSNFDLDSGEDITIPRRPSPPRSLRISEGEDARAKDLENDNAASEYGVQEFRKVENMVRHKTPRNKHRSARQRQLSPVDSNEEGESTKSPYFESNKQKTSAGATQSPPRTANRSKSDRSGSRADLNAFDTLLTPIRSPKPKSSSKKQSSSDELDCMTTVGQPIKSPQKPRSPDAFAKLRQGLSVSATRGTTSAQLAQRYNHSPNSTRTKVDSSLEQSRKVQQRHNETYRLTGINIIGRDMFYQSDDLSLIYNDQRRLYQVFEGDTLARFEATLTEIDPRKVIKLMHDSIDSRLRLEFSKTEAQENVLDIQFESQQELDTFLARVASLGSVGSKFLVSSSKMCSMFERRRKECAAYRTSRMSLSAAKSAEVDEKATADVNTSGPKTSVMKKLMARLTARQDQEEVRHGPAKKSVSSEGQRKVTTGSNLDSLRPNHNNHLRRKTRNSLAAEFFTSPSKETIASAPNTPDQYSAMQRPGPKWDKPLTYPREGKKKATVEWADLDRLNEGEFLNDSIISFWMRFLEYQLEQRDPILAKRIYFFNTFFFERLTSNRKDKREINYSGVEKWTRTVDIFTYDYIVVPVNESAHWYLAIIANLPKLKTKAAVDPVKDGDTKTAILTTDPPESNDSACAPQPLEKVGQFDCDKSSHESARRSLAELELSDSEKPGREALQQAHIQHGAESALREGESPIHQAELAAKSFYGTDARKPKRKSLPAITHIDSAAPVILTLDSLDSSHPLPIRMLKKYLWEEGKAKRSGTEFDVTSIRGVTAKNVPLQQNFSDCGLYMLGYIEKFLHDGPGTFIDKVVKRQYQSTDWPKLQASAMRKELRQKMLQLHEEQSSGQAAEQDKKSCSKASTIGDATSEIVDPRSLTTLAASSRESLGKDTAEPNLHGSSTAANGDKIDEDATIKTSSLVNRLDNSHGDQDAPISISADGESQNINTIGSSSFPSFNDANNQSNTQIMRSDQNLTADSRHSQREMLLDELPMPQEIPPQSAISRGADSIDNREDHHNDEDHVKSNIHDHTAPPM